MTEHTIEMQKNTFTRQADATLHAQIDKIVDRIQSHTRRLRGWSARRGLVFTDSEQGQVTSKIKLTVCCSKDQNAHDIEQILGVVQAAANGPKWQITKVDGKPRDVAPKEVDYVDIHIPDDWLSHFSHLYGLDSQIRVAMSSIQAALDSDWRNRFHCTFVGAAASGKTDTARTFKSLFGEEAVLEYDATSTTMAGAIKDLDSREMLPRILIVEEIEKAREEDFRWLLAVLDWRAEIRKINYRQQIHRETKFLGIVTVNDYPLFQSLMSGALASRCGDPIYFPQPSRDVLKRILTREVERVRGSAAWIEPALDYAQRVGMSDPRHVLAVCLRGKDDLLSGLYQEQLLAVRCPEFSEICLTAA